MNQLNDILEVASVGAAYLDKLANEGHEYEAVKTAYTDEGYDLEAIKTAFDTEVGMDKLAAETDTETAEKLAGIIEVATLGAAYLDKLATDGYNMEGLVEDFASAGYDLPAIKEAFEADFAPFVKEAEEKEDSKEDNKEDEKEDKKEDTKEEKKEDDKEEKKEDEKEEKKEASGIDTFFEKLASEGADNEMIKEAAINIINDAYEAQVKAVQVLESLGYEFK